MERVQSIGLLEGRCISMKIKEKLMHKYALSPQGASDMLKAFVSVTVSDLVSMKAFNLERKREEWRRCFKILHW